MDHLPHDVLYGPHGSPGSVKYFKTQAFTCRSLVCLGQKAMTNVLKVITLKDFSEWANHSVFLSVLAFSDRLSASSSFNFSSPY